MLQAVFDGLSPLSRHRRFHGPMPVLTRLAKQRLAAVDGREHLAFAAFAGTRAIGIARLVATGDQAGELAGELAVEVVDAWHRRGVGTRLARAVVARGCLLGYREFAADVLAENRAVQALFRKVFGDVAVAVDGWELRLTARLADRTCAA
ncbi:acetyltransferase (GNAT) family protein [Labedaea rhizosphaerae]|uniref:Acetyltransferase (GNAT) family protein n=1 Tax=Labedaea rhizosphaerae TaxID=598644 RepID=A0A4R6SE62_LABRH|nr:acetyltransferase (GNAT) family protein [Labedaea rhizosphaerae]